MAETSGGIEQGQEPSTGLTRDELSEFLGEDRLEQFEQTITTETKETDNGSEDRIGGEQGRQDRPAQQGTENQGRPEGQQDDLRGTDKGDSGGQEEQIEEQAETQSTTGASGAQAAAETEADETASGSSAASPEDGETLSEADRLRTIINEMAANMMSQGVAPSPQQTAQLQQVAGQLKQAQEQEAQDQGQVQTEAKPTPAPTPAPIKFVENDDQLYEILRSSDTFNDFMRTLTNNIIEQANLQSANVSYYTARQVSQGIAMLTDFFANNKELLPHRDFAGYVIQQVEAQNPNLSPQEVLKLASTEIRKKLALGQGTGTGASAGTAAPQAQNTRASSPALVSSGGRTKSSGKKVELTGMAKDMMDMLKAAGKIR